MTGLERRSKRAVTIDRLRSHDCREFLVYRVALGCNYRAILNADDLPDKLPIRSLCPRMLCTRCGHRGADVRPDWRPLTNKRYV
jgi:hypothetical protein